MSRLFTCQVAARHVIRIALLWVMVLIKHQLITILIFKSPFPNDTSLVMHQNVEISGGLIQ